MTTTPNQTTREEISGALERAIDRIMGVEVPAMNGDNLAVTLCSVFDDPDQEADDETGWTEAATDGYEQVCAAIRALFDPVVQSLAALQSPTDREGDRLAEDWLRGDWYEKWQDATENADAELMTTLDALRIRVERTITAALSRSIVGEGE